MFSSLELERQFSFPRFFVSVVVLVTPLCVVTLCKHYAADAATIVLIFRSLLTMESEKPFRMQLFSVLPKHYKTRGWKESVIMAHFTRCSHLINCLPHTLHTHDDNQHPSSFPFHQTIQSTNYCRTIFQFESTPLLSALFGSRAPLPRFFSIFLGSGQLLFSSSSSTTTNHFQFATECAPLFLLLRGPRLYSCLISAAIISLQFKPLEWFRLLPPAESHNRHN